MSSVFTYRALQDCDVEKVKEMLHYDFFDPEDGEPISHVLKFDIPRETKCYVEAIMPGVIEDDISAVAVSKGPEEVVGIGLSHYITRENTRKISFPRDDPDTKNMWLTFDILDKAENGIDIFDKFNVSAFVYFHTLAVKPGNRRLGIGRNLAEKACEFAKAKGATVVAVTAASSYIKTICDKLGFKTLHQVRYHDYMLEGERFCPESGINGHKYCSFLAKCI